MTVALADASRATDRLAHFPVPLFSSVMGLAGLTLATRRFEATTGLFSGVADGLFWLSAAVWAAIAVVYAMKAATRWAAVKAEWTHPVRIAFFPAISVGLILLAGAALPINRSFALGLWSVGSALHLTLTLMVVTAWIDSSRYKTVHLNPAWFIPVVGNILVPIAGVSLAPLDVSWFAFSIGLLFWLVLLAALFYRLIFHDQLPAKLLPTLFILIAPPAVGFVSWTALVGGVDAAGRILFFAAVFFFLLMLAQVRKLARVPFALSWWAYSFPLAALTIAHFVMAEKTGAGFYRVVGVGLWALVVIVIGGLTIRTVFAMARGQICVPEA